MEYRDKFKFSSSKQESDGHPPTFTCNDTISIEHDVHIKWEPEFIEVVSVKLEEDLVDNEESGNGFFEEEKTLQLNKTCSGDPEIPFVVCGVETLDGKYSTEVPKNNEKEVVLSYNDRVKENLATSTGGSRGREDSLKNKPVKKPRVKMIYNCGECQQEYSTLSNFQRHKKIHSGEKPYPCTHCTKTFRELHDLNRHIRIHTGEKPFSCSLCPSSFSVAYDLKRHLKIHTGEKPFICGQCSKSFCRSSELNRHLKTHSGEKPFVCTQCPKAFSGSSDLKRHMRTHTGEKFACSQCPSTFTRSGNLKEHITRSHTDTDGVSTTTNDSFSCLRPMIKAQTEHSFDSLSIDKTAQEENYNLNENDFKYQCKVISPLSEGDSQTSTKKVRKEGTNIRKGGNRYICSECGKRFPGKGQLRIHIRIHTGERPFLCPDCGKDFSQKIHLKEHMKVHSGEKSFKCRECGKEFSHNSNLKRHLRIHSGEKLFECSDCGKAFTQNTSLKQHVKIHSGEKPFKCSICGKAWSLKNDLKKHLMTHTGEKPFQCVFCGKTFSRKHHLRKHENIHNGDS